MLDLNPPRTGSFAGRRESAPLHPLEFARQPHPSVQPVNLTLKQFRAFAAIAELGSFTAAADRLQLTPSALSLLIKQLEDTLGQRLIERGQGRTKLAEAGTHLLPKVHDVLGAVEDGMKSVRQLRNQTRGRVRIACTLS
ncbi:MAG: LysR family transcriptional regulator [Betaproteobacteria bacterium]|nr:LysR family transcriptional regulator [Betaproteobacteria bacterium]